MASDFETHRSSKKDWLKKKAPLSSLWIKDQSGFLPAVMEANLF